MAASKSKSVCIIQGHPHRAGRHLCHALADAYARGVKRAGASVTRIDVGALEFAFLQDPADFLTAPPPEIMAAQEKVRKADHLLVVYPLWLGAMPARTKAFFEQLARHEFAISQRAKGWPKKNLAGKSARIIVTMGMPGAAYRLLLGAHGSKSFESGVLAMSGVRPIRSTLIGGVGEVSPQRTERLLQRLEALGEKLS